MNSLQPRADHQFDPSAPHPELDGVDMSKLENTDWNNNSDPFGIFAAKGLSAPKMMSPADVHREAREKSSKVFRDYLLLQEIVMRHEAKIQKRWEKKTKVQRLAILLEAWPGMPTTHRPDFAAFRKYGSRLKDAATECLSSFMWPNVNQEDLAKPKTLLMLLNARGRNHPSVFAAADGESMHLGLVSMVIIPVFLNGNVMLLNGMTREEDYGRLLDWNEHEDAFDWMSTRKQFLPGEGLVILEIQGRLLSFLISCCNNILHDIPSTELASKIYPIQPEPPFKASVDPSGFTSLAIMAEEAPYRIPAKLDLQKIESLLAARASHAEDHIWALREDPGYFADALLESREHRQELLKDIQGDVHPTLKPPREGLLCARIIGSTIVEAIFQLELFSELHSQASKLNSLQKKYETAISPLKDLPEEYLGALLKFRHYLNQVAKGPLNQLKMAVVASPPMRGFFVREVPTSATTSMINIMSKPGMKMDKITEYLFWLLQTLWEDGQNLFLCRLPAVVDELERLLKAEQKARDMISSYVAMLISELSIIAECLRQLEIYQPWANGFENAAAERDSDIKREYAQRNKAAPLVLSALRVEHILKIYTFGDPSDKKFDYPVGKRRNKANIEKLRTAEAHLDNFWAKLDDLLYARAGGLDGTALRRFLSQPRLLQRTPEWIELAAGKPENSQKGTSSELDAPIMHLSTMFLGPESSSGRKEVLASGVSKNKVKTREKSSAISADSTVIIERPVETKLDDQPIFSVDARALKVFRIVFFDPEANTTSGEVAWSDFLYAMIYTGFSAQKLYGSVWHFQPTNLGVETSIQFHEPHPHGKIPFFVARRHGRRLTRSYGWSGGMFVLKDK